MAAMEAVMLETLPRTMFVPMLAITANPVDARNRKGSIHELDMASKTTRRMAKASGIAQAGSSSSSGLSVIHCMS